jgi:hypothetical protein
MATWGSGTKPTAFLLDTTRLFTIICLRLDLEGFSLSFQRLDKERVLVPVWQQNRKPCETSRNKRQLGGEESTIPSNASIAFQGGMLVLQHADSIERASAAFQFVNDRWCCEAHHYHAVLPWLQGHGNTAGTLNAALAEMSPSSRHLLRHACAIR